MSEEIGPKIEPFELGEYDEEVIREAGETIVGKVEKLDGVGVYDDLRRE